jgi:hypothetical protein
VALCGVCCVVDLEPDSDDPGMAGKTRRVHAPGRHVPAIALKGTFHAPVPVGFRPAMAAPCRK